MRPMAQRPFFISHAVKDQKLVDALVDALTTSGVASPDDIFCSSLEGMGIPRGQNFIDFIKGQLDRPRLVVIILSQNYYESAFCMCELRKRRVSSGLCRKVRSSTETA